MLANCSILYYNFRIFSEKNLAKASTEVVWLQNLWFMYTTLKVGKCMKMTIFYVNWPNIRSIRTIRIFDWKVFYIRRQTIPIRIGNPSCHSDHCLALNRQVTVARRGGLTSTFFHSWNLPNSSSPMHGVIQNCAF